MGVQSDTQESSDRRQVTSLLELADVLRDYVGIEGGFRDNTRLSSLQSQTSKIKYEGRDLVCFRCKVSGHKASDSPSKNGNRPSGISREWNGIKGNGNGRVVCYSARRKAINHPSVPMRRP